MQTATGALSEVERPPRVCRLLNLEIISTTAGEVNLRNAQQTGVTSGSLHKPHSVGVSDIIPSKMQSVKSCACRKLMPRESPLPDISPTRSPELRAL